MDKTQKTSPFLFRIIANPNSTDRVPKTCGLCQSSDSASVSTLDMLNRPKDIKVLKYLALKLDIDFRTSIKPNLATFPFCFWCWGLYNKLFTFWMQHDMEDSNLVAAVYKDKIEAVVLEFQNQKNPPQPGRKEMISTDKAKGQPSASNSKAPTGFNLPISSNTLGNQPLNSKSLKTYGGELTSAVNSSSQFSFSDPWIPTAKTRLTNQNVTEKSTGKHGPGILRRKSRTEKESEEIQAIEVIRSRVNKPLNSSTLQRQRPSHKTLNSIIIDTTRRKQNLGNATGTIKKAHRKQVIVLKVNRPLSSVNLQSQKDFGNVAAVELTEQSDGIDYEKPEIEVIHTDSQSSFSPPFVCNNSSKINENFGNGKTTAVHVVQFTGMSNGMEYEEPEIEGVEPIDPLCNFSASSGSGARDSAQINHLTESSDIEYEEPELELIKTIQSKRLQPARGNINSSAKTKNQISANILAAPNSHQSPDGSEKCPDDDCDPLLYDLNLSDPFASMDNPQPGPTIWKYSVVAEHSYSKSIGELKCELCGPATSEIFLSDLKLFQHIYSLHNTSHKAFVCLQCGKSFVAQVLLNRHVEFHSSDKTKPMACDVCEERFATAEKLSDHLFNQHSKIRDQARCLFCRKTTNNLLELRKHEMKVHHSKLDHNCNQCKVRFSDRELLETHENCHSQVPFTCTICKLSFTADYLLGHHLLFHLPERKPLKKDVKSTKNESQTFTCAYKSCGRVFKRLESFRNHKYSHKTTRKKRLTFKCEFCSVMFIHHRGAVEHTLKTHESKVEAKEKNLSCPTCDKKYCSKLLWDRHVKLHKLDDEKPLECEICEDRFAKGNEQGLENHLKKHRREHSMWCKVCQKGFYAKPALQSHELSHPSLLIYPCLSCEKRYVSEVYLETHVKTHTEGPYNCTVCKSSENLSTGELLAEHLLTHTKEARRKCPECPTLLRDKGSLKAHLAKEHGHAKEFVCHICGYEFSLKMNFDRHLKHVHPDPASVQQSWLCEICGKNFQDSSRLYAHNYIHHQKRGKFKCQVCNDNILECNFDSHMSSCHPSVPYLPKGKRLRGRLATTNSKKRIINPTPLQPDISTDSPLMRLIPGGEKGEFACSICDKVFKRQRQLTYHINTHTGEKPYKCKFCDRTFPNPMHMRGHMQVHWKDETGTERKKFACTLCDRAFYVRHQLEFHMNKHKGLKPYECRICHKKFSHPGLIGHFKVHMGNGTYVPPTSTDGSDIQELEHD